MTATVVEDQGGATMTVKLSERLKPISVHKGMVFLKKYSDAWFRQNGIPKANYIIHDKIRDKQKIAQEPVAFRTRNKMRR